MRANGTQGGNDRKTEEQERWPGADQGNRTGVPRHDRTRFALRQAFCFSPLGNALQGLHKYLFMYSSALADIDPMFLYHILIWGMARQERHFSKLGKYKQRLFP